MCCSVDVRCSATMWYSVSVWYSATYSSGTQRLSGTQYSSGPQRLSGGGVADRELSKQLGSAVKSMKKRCTGDAAPLSSVCRPG
eukprot:6492310-Amphidinium_carterae.1